jgi:phage head maturation protease
LSDSSGLVAKNYKGLADEFVNANCTLDMSLASGLNGHLDPYQTKHPIINLFTNAVKYGAGTKISISFRICRESSSSDSSR